MGVKSEKKRLIEVLGEPSNVLEFTENLFNQIQSNKRSKAFKKAIKNTLAEKFKEVQMIGCSEADKNMRKNLHQFYLNITSDEKYQNCVLEIKRNIKQVNFSNLLKEIQNSNKNIKKRNNKRKRLG